MVISMVKLYFSLYSCQKSEYARMSLRLVLLRSTINKFFPSVYIFMGNLLLNHFLKKSEWFCIFLILMEARSDQKCYCLICKNLSANAAHYCIVEK